MDIKGIENIRAHRPVRKWDIVVLLLFIAVIVSIIVVALMPKGGQVEVYEDGDLVYLISLSEYGEYNVHDKLTVVVDEQGVSVKNATCPDKLCEMQGHINTFGASIVCLPNKITIVVKGDKDDIVVVG